VAQARRSSTEAVVAAASKVFLEKGYQNATISDIAEAAGISRPTIYQYAPSKKWLLERIAQIVIEEGRTFTDDVKARDLPPLERLTELVRGHVTRSVKYRVSLGIMTSEAAEFSPEQVADIRARVREAVNDIRAALAELVEQGVARSDVDLDVAASMLHTSLVNVYRWYDESVHGAVEHVAEEVLKMLSGLLLAGEHAPSRVGH
jgi:TetR/AcrR family transcriptional regulator, cholesterol catabolism regulator